MSSARVLCAVPQAALRYRKMHMRTHGDTPNLFVDCATGFGGEMQRELREVP